MGKQNYERMSLAIPTEDWEHFEECVTKLMEFFNTDSKNKAIFCLVTGFERILFESERYRRILSDVEAYEALYERKHGDRRVRNSL